MNKNLVLLIPFLVCTQIPALSQILEPPFDRIVSNAPLTRALVLHVDCSSDLRTSRQMIMDTDFPMPAFGVKKCLAILGHRLNYAETQGWLSQPLLATLNIQYLELAKRVSSPAGPSSSSALEIYRLNETFMQSTVLDEMAQPGKEGLMAREMNLRQRLQLARVDSYVNSEKVADLNRRLASISQGLATANLDQIQMDELSVKLAAVARQLTQDNNTGLALRGIAPQ
jgi:hypothetical protein